MPFEEVTIGSARLIRGDCREVLSAIPAESVHCCVTSPPYWGLRDYGTPPQIWGGDPACRHRWGAEGKGHNPGRSDHGTGDPTSRLGPARDGIPGGSDQGRGATSTGTVCLRCGAWRGSLGLEPTPAAYIANLVEIMRGVRRVLRSDGTLWLNIGDCYASGSGGDKSIAGDGRVAPGKARKRQQISGLKSKDLIGIPWMLAFALRDDGWYLRRDIIWHKPNPMPESVRDRCTSSHEYLFMLTKSGRYYYDGEAIKEPNAEPRGSGGWQSYARSGKAGWHAQYPKTKINNDRADNSSLNDYQHGGGRNKRSVWTIATAPFRGAHFATFPPALVEPCILAGTSDRGVCPKCGAPWERVVKKTAAPTQQTGWQRRLTAAQVSRTGGAKSGGTNSTTFGLAAHEMPARETIGWQPTCSCDAGRPVPATVLDPFAGACTTALVATGLGRRSVSIELSAAYHDIACERIAAIRKAEAA